jgi:predicted O-methyltransferase YrrM
MSRTGIDEYADLDVPPLVRSAVTVTRRLGFDASCRPRHRALRRVLAGGVGAGVIGETGTGCGVGLAWLASGADPRARLISVEREPERASAAADVFHTTPQVRVINGDWTELRAHGPFDLLVLDGGGHGKGTAEPLDPTAWLNLGATIVIDDFTPTTEWPPSFGGTVDRRPAVLAGAPVPGQHPGTGGAGDGDRDRHPGPLTLHRGRSEHAV